MKLEGVVGNSYLWGKEYDGVEGEFLIIFQNSAIHLRNKHNELLFYA